LDETFYKAYNNKGTIYFGQKNFDDALAQFKKALEININYHTARINLGITLNEMGSF
jgi:superkiller protein 3